MYFDKKNKYYRSGSEPKEKEHEQIVYEESLDIAIRSYMGGLNTSFIRGEIEGDILDIDFSSCYPTVLNMIKNLTYTHTGGIEEFEDELQKYDGTNLPIAFADVEFEFPSDCKFPSLPIKNGDDGLFYVLKGRTTCSLPEIHLAIHQGCKIIYRDAVVMSTHD